MSFLRRKANAKMPAPQPAPQVYVWHDQVFMSTTSRFFFTETLIEGKTERTPLQGGRVTWSSPGFSPEVRALQERIIDSVPGLTSEYSLRPRFYGHYIAISWIHDDQPFELIEEMTASVEKSVVALLAEHFGWEQPLVEHFRDRSEMNATANLLKVNWRLGHNP